MPYLSVSGTNLWYDETGSPAGRPLLLLHAALQTADSLQPLRDLAEPLGYRVVAMDQRGHGRSANPAQGLSVARLADDALEVIGRLNLRRPAVIGYSMGGSVGLELARLGGLSQLVVMASRARPAAGGRAAFDPVRIKQHMPQWAIQLNQKHTETFWEELSRQIGAMFETWSGLTEADLAVIRCPVLVVQGDKDEMVPVTEAQHLAAAIPGAELHIAPHARHPELLYRADALKAVQAFLWRNFYSQP